MIQSVETGRIVKFEVPLPFIAQDQVASLEAPDLLVRLKSILGSDVRMTADSKGHGGYEVSVESAAGDPTLKSRVDGALAAIRASLVAQGIGELGV